MRLDKNFLTETRTFTYFTDSDKCIYIDIRQSKGYTGEFERVTREDSNLSITVDLKAAAAKKLRLRVTGYFQGEYMYMLDKDGLIMNYKEYRMNKNLWLRHKQWSQDCTSKKQEQIILVLEKKDEV